MERFEEFDNKLFGPPSNEHVYVWRYMDFTRFVALLNSASLCLTRCDQFDDQYEGAVQNKGNQSRRGAYKNEITDKDSVSPEQLSAVLGSLWKKYQHQYVFINCWHMADYESAAMWRSYRKANATIAIQTTYAKLRNALPDSCHIGEVNYVDHQTYIKDEKEGFFSVMCKRKSFEHERELRICYVDSYEFQQDSKDSSQFLGEPNTRLQESVPVDLQVLIESVRVAPGEPTWLVELIKDTIIRFGYRLPVCQSNFDEYPLF
ncbi:hypothetical protein [Spirosoma pollinicola]|uniref:DUF2971 domain-containing protein n=1 Tax=Spirosoma pollinicola TaxID=2057025 RepID=A0A2K8Z3I4_9BACT|nr:hypothetical protein [Spirosoma pollinicola]AUD04446.1 hypothetical protein CWM47_22935 [Spirosoma pollinicola]